MAGLVGLAEFSFRPPGYDSLVVWPEIVCSGTEEELIEAVV